MGEFERGGSISNALAMSLTLARESDEEVLVDEHSLHVVQRSLHISPRPATPGNLARMCRKIRVLHNFEPPTTDDEVREAALQFERKVSGSTHPSRANTEAFDRAIDEIAQATRRLLDGLVTNAPPKDRDVEAIKGRQRHEKRMEREVRIRTASV
jgi:hypothetical protein